MYWALKVKTALFLACIFTVTTLDLTKVANRIPASTSHQYSCIDLIKPFLETHQDSELIEFARSLPDQSIIWSGGSRRDPLYNAQHHFDKHGKEFPEFKSSLEYVKFTHEFMTNPPDGTLHHLRYDGDQYFYHPETETFGVMNRDGVPKTLFRPDPKKHRYESNLEYYRMKAGIELQ
ncbi:MAG: hypothetical protein KAG61_13635 [Bacteriovoracaceae bacterium]|nr:hypothetical protein [Bacteriovoracaceae bacterium]